MFFKKKKVRKIIKYFIKFTVISLSLLYILFIGFYEYFSAQTNQKQNEIIKNIVYKFIDKNLISFDISGINQTGDFMYITIENFVLKSNQQKEFKLFIKKIDVYISPLEILKFQAPVGLTSLESLKLDVLFDPTKEPAKDASEIKNEIEINYLNEIKAIKQIITHSPKYVRTLLKKGINIENAELNLIFHGQKNIPILLKKFVIKPQKFALTRLYSEIDIKAQLNKAELDINLKCDLKLTHKLIGCFTTISGKNLTTMKADLEQMDSMFKFIPVLDSFDLEFDLYLDGLIFIDRFRFLSEKSKILFDKEFFRVDKILLKSKFDTVTLSILDLIIDIEDFQVKNKTPELLTFLKNDIKGDISLKVDNLKWENIEKIWPNMLLKDVKDFLSRSKLWASGISAEMIFNTGSDWNIIVKLNETGIENLYGSVSGFVLENSTVSINNKRVIVQSKNAFAKDGNIKISSPELVVLYEDTNNITLDLKTEKANILTFAFLKSLFAGNKELDSLCSGIFTDITGKSELSEESDTRFLVKFAKTSINLSSDDIFSNMLISANGNFDSKNIQFIESEEGDVVNFSINKKRNSDIDIDLGFVNPIPSHLFKTPGNISNISTKISLKDSLMIIFTEIKNKAKQNIFTSKIKSSQDGFSIKAEAGIEVGEFLKLNLEMFTKSKELLLNLQTRGINLGHLLDSSFKFSENKSANEENKIKEWDVDIDISDILMRNEVKLDELNLKAKLDDYRIKNIDLYLKATGGKDSDIFTISELDKKGENFAIKSQGLKNIFDGILDAKDQMKITDISGSLLLLDGVSQIRVRTGESAIKLPNQNTLLMNVLKPVIPGFSTLNNSLLYSKMSLDSKWFLSENSSILTIDDFYMKSLISRITSLGYIDFTKQYINISGKIDTAYKFNKILTAEEIPFLNKILTLGSKDGGYGVISYNLKGKFAELDAKSLKMSGDRSNFIVAGGLIMINPLFAIPVFATTKTEND